MVTCIIKDNGEPKVIELTYENLWKELKHIPGAEVIVAKDWVGALDKVNNKFVCFVEADCLVSSGYFDSLTGYLVKRAQELNKLAVLSTATAVNNWAVRFYGYNLTNEYSGGVVPNKHKKDTSSPLYTMQIAYVPGALIRVSFLKKVLEEITPKDNWTDDLVYFSTELSLGCWRKNWQVYLAPNSTYVTTEDYVNDIAELEIEDKELQAKFLRESI